MTQRLEALRRAGIDRPVRFPPARLPTQIGGALIAAALLTNAVAADELVLKARKIYTMAGASLEPGMVLVRDGKIADVAGKLDVLADARVIDLGDAVLMPGLVDAFHDAGVTGGSSERTLEIAPNFATRDAIDWQSRSFRELLGDGITSVHVAPGADGVIGGTSCIVKTSGPRALRMIRGEAGLVITVSTDATEGNRARSRPDSIYVRQPTNRMGVVWMLRSTFNASARGAASPASAETPVARALAGKLPIYSLCRTQHDITGLLNVAKEFNLTATVVGGHEAYRVAELLVATKTPVILGRLTTGSLIGPEETRLFWNQAATLESAGVPIALSGGQLMEQAQFARRFGLAHDAALRSITSTPARLLGVDDRVGAIAVGRDADLIAFNGEPLEFTSALVWVMVDGVLQTSRK